MPALPRVLRFEQKHFTELPSTNSWLKEMLSQKSLSEGFCVSTDYQSSGRGQFGKSWASPRGQNLLLSVLLRPDFLPLSQSFRLTLTVCLSAVDLCEAHGLYPALKWPNDLYYQGRKLAGVLLEAGVTGQKMDYCIAGLGLNIGQTDFGDLAATSWVLAGIDAQPLPLLRAQFLGYLQERYRQLQSPGGASQQQADFEARLYGREKAVVVQHGARRDLLYCVGLNEEGHLIGRWPEGQRQIFRHGELSFLGEEAAL